MIVRFNIDTIDNDHERISGRGIVTADNLEEAIKKLFCSVGDEVILSLSVEVFDCEEDNGVYYFYFKEVEDKEIKLSNFVKEVENNGNSGNDN